MKTSLTCLDYQIGTKVATARIASGLSVDELAERMDLSRDMIVSIERGAMRIAAPQICKFASVLNVEIRWFFKGMNCASQAEREESKVTYFDKALASDALKRLVRASAIGDPPKPNRIKSA